MKLTVHRQSKTQRTRLDLSHNAYVLHIGITSRMSLVDPEHNFGTGHKRSVVAMLTKAITAKTSGECICA